MTGRACLYRMYGADGGLLYVGQTLRGPARLAQHRQQKDWWPSVYAIVLQHVTDPAELDRAERNAIARERPHWNKTFRAGEDGESDVWQVAGKAFCQPDTGEWLWYCAECLSHGVTWTREEAWEQSVVHQRITRRNLEEWGESGPCDIFVVKPVDNALRLAAANLSEGVPASVQTMMEDE